MARAQVLAPLVADGRVQVTEGAFGITVEINASVLFAPGEAQLQAPTRCRAAWRSGRWWRRRVPITVEGHTDVTADRHRGVSVQLGAVGGARLNVVRLFVDSGVRPSRLTAAGYGDQRPVADNATADGRA